MLSEKKTFSILIGDVSPPSAEDKVGESIREDSLFEKAGFKRTKTLILLET